MANWFPPTLGDVDQLFPPSDMFSRTQISCNHYHRSSFLGSSSSIKDELDIARCLAALSLLQEHSSSRASVPFFTQQPPPPSITQRVKPPMMGRSVSLNHVARGNGSLHGTGGCGGGAGLSGVGRLRGNGTGRLSSRADPAAYEFQVRPKVERFLEAKRARAYVQKQQYRVPGRIYPFQGNRLGTNGGRGGGRETGGTGVFHPRVADDYHPTTIMKRVAGGRVKREVQVAQQRETMDTVRRFGAREVQVAQQRETNDTMRKFGASSKQEEDCHNHDLPPDMRLPREWTY